MNNPDPIDVYVGSRLRYRRRELELSQEKFGSQLNVSYQNISKNETGENRISASALRHFAAILGVTEGYFYEGAPVSPCKKLT